MVEERRQDANAKKNNNDVYDDIELQAASTFKGSNANDLNTSTSNSAASSILENLSQISEQQQQLKDAQQATEIEQYLYDEDPEEGAESRNLLTSRLEIIRKSYASQKKCLVIFAIIFVMWLVALISYSQGSKHPHTSHTDDSNEPTVTSPGDGQTQAPTKSKGKTSSSGKSKIRLLDYRMANFFVFDVEFNFVGDSNYVVKTGRNYEYKNFENADKSQLFDSLEFEYGENSYRVSDIQMSPNMTHVMLVTNQESQWRHSSWAQYWIYNRKTKTIEPLFEEMALLNSAQWSPQGRHVSFVYQHDVYIKTMDTGEILRLTEDGSADIFNGKPDWVYEEEVLSTDNSIWWSPDDSNLVYMKLDDTKVPIHNLEFFVQDRDEIYPSITELKYPKPGFDNPRPTLVNYNLAAKKETVLPKSEFGDEWVLYLAKFISGNELLFKETDRESNIMNVNIYNTDTGTLTKTRRIESKSYGGWIEKPSPLVLVCKDGFNGYIDTVVYNQYNHLAYFQNVTDATPYKMLTQGKFDITDEYSYSAAHDEVYLISTVEGDPLSHHLFKISLSNYQLQNLTDTSEKAYYDITFNSDASHAVLNYQGPDIPYQKMVKLDGFNKAYYDKLPMMNNNQIAKMGHERFAVPTTTYADLEFDGLKFQYIEVRPADFDPAKKYPLLVSIYGGPGSIKLSNAYSVGFEHVVSSSLDAVVIFLDPRGTGGKGWDFKKFANEKIGHWEPRDITNITKILLAKKSYIDKARTAIWGWSYGGFTTLKTLEYDAGSVFKYGMAVAPVTNWLFYDSIYTERFMNKPENNAKGYEESKVNNIKNFKKVKRFLVMHGTGDDNVHLQNTFNLLDEFDMASVENYDMHVFPDSNHSIYYNNANAIVYDKLFNWLKKAFAGKF